MKLFLYDNSLQSDSLFYTWNIYIEPHKFTFGLSTIERNVILNINQSNSGLTQSTAFQQVYYKWDTTANAVSIAMPARELWAP